MEKFTVAKGIWFINECWIIFDWSVVLQSLTKEGKTFFQFITKENLSQKNNLIYTYVLQVGVVIVWTTIFCNDMESRGTGRYWMVKGFYSRGYEILEFTPTSSLGILRSSIPTELPVNLHSIVPMHRSIPFHVHSSISMAIASKMNGFV